ncbi:hypothetical protein DSO57_1024311 [Entomophthora muscae]|uniref:Uncharacterized protein n=1 Tax=Entomophthora muscae TaxID=34485 RepID=A0ACC2T2I0_9FUNG|nr:hypothetical protein DSO57_1024311 [Entomophthora muscae]
MDCEDTGGVKKMRAKGGATSAPSAALACTGDVPVNWEAQWVAGTISDGNGKSWHNNSEAKNKGAAEAGLGPGEELDDSNWIDKISDKDFDVLHANLSPKQKNEILSRKRLFRELLDSYDIDVSTAQSWEDDGVCLQDVLKWRSVGLTLEQTKLWLHHQFTVDAATKWCNAGIDVHAASVFCKHQVPRVEALAWVNTGLPLDFIAYIARFCVSFVQAEPWIANRYCCN